MGNNGINAAGDGNSTQEERNIISALKGKVLTIDTESEDQSKQISKENELGQGNHVQKRVYLGELQR